jgi:hypothetical protein
MKHSFLRIALTIGIAGFGAAQAGADQTPITAGLNAPVIGATGGSQVYWGPIVSQSSLGAKGTTNTNYPQKFAGTSISGSGGSAGSRNYCVSSGTPQQGPGPAPLYEWFCNWPVDAAPQVSFEDYRYLAQLQGNSCAGQSCLNPTSTSGINDPVCSVNGHPKVWFFDGDVAFSGATYFCGVLVSKGSIKFTGNGAGANITAIPPASAWEEYQVATPNGTAGDSGASDEYPGDAGLHAVKPYSFSTGGGGFNASAVTFQGYVFASTGYTGGGGTLVLGAVQFGQGAASTSGGGTIFFQPQIIFSPPPVANTVDMPIITPPGGTFCGPVQVTIGDVTPGSEIRYTTDGTTPDQTSALYSGTPLNLSADRTLLARGFAPGMNPSAVARAVFTFTCGGTPPPILTSLSPSSAVAGSQAFTLTVNGGNFVNGAVVTWNGSDRNTAFGNSGQLTALISAADVANVGSASVQVRNPDTQTSNALLFSITASASQIQFNPTTYSVAEDAGRATITVTRTADTSGTSTVQYASANGTATAGQDYVAVLGTLTFNPGETSKTFDVPILMDRLAEGSETVPLSLSRVTGATLGASQAVLTITDQTPTPPPPPNPFISELLPYSARVDATLPFTMRVLGTGFDPSSPQVLWNGSSILPIVSNSATEIDVTVDPVLWNNTVGPYAVMVRNPGPVDSNQATFTVEPVTSGNPPPILSSLTPAATTAGSAAFTLTVNGANFLDGAIVTWNGLSRSTQFQSALQLTALISAADVASVGSASVRVNNPDNQTSNTLLFSITPAPVSQIQFNPTS